MRMAKEGLEELFADLEKRVACGDLIEGNLSWSRVNGAFEVTAEIRSGDGAAEGVEMIAPSQRHGRVFRWPKNKIDTSLLDRIEETPAGNAQVGMLDKRIPPATLPADPNQEP